MSPIIVPEVAEPPEERVKFGSRKLTALVAARFTLTARHDKDVKQ